MKVTKYTVRDDRIVEPFLIAHVSDLHEHSCGELIDLLEQAQPDLILCTGDMLERHSKSAGASLKKRKIEKPHHVLYHFLARDGIRDGGMLYFHQSVSIAPVFYSLGNHEKYIRNEDRLRCRGYGVHILDNQDECIDVQGNKVRIGGLSYRADWNWCEQFSQKDGIRILMAHHPEYVADHMLKDDQILPLDLILSGHAHGGQLAFLDHSLYSPGQGFLPKYTKGMRMTSHGMWIISAGTANTIKVPRFNNPTELVLIEMGGKS